MKVLRYTDPMIPASWIAAHGFRPMLHYPGSCPGAVGRRMGVCTHARALYLDFLEGRLSGDALLLSTSCDQMRRIAGRIQQARILPVFLFNMPATWQSPNARTLYSSELNRLAAFLFDRGGRLPSKTELAFMIDDFDTRRKKLFQARTCLPYLEYRDLARGFFESGVVGDFKRKIITESPFSPRIAILGGPLFREHRPLLELIDHAGGRVELDATIHGECLFHDPPQKHLLQENPAESLVSSVFDAFPSPRRRPDSFFHQWLHERLEARRIHGIILLYHSWCDIWKAQAPMLKNNADRPFLSVELPESCRAALPGIKTRIQAFLELLRARIQRSL